MKITNEIKVGTFTALVIVALFLSYQFIKGKKRFNHQFTVYAVFNDVTGLNNKAVVKYKGLTIGITGNAQKLDQKVSKIVIPIQISEPDILIPKNSVAILRASGLGIASADLELIAGNDTVVFLKNGDTIKATQSVDVLSKLMKAKSPLIYDIENTTNSLDSVLQIITSTLDPKARADFKSILENLKKTSDNLKKVSQ